MKKLTMLLVLISAPIFANDDARISCKINGQDVKLKTQYTCWATGDRVFNSLNEIDAEQERVMQENPGIDGNTAYRLACGMINDHYSFSYQGEDFRATYSIRVNSDRPSDDFMYIESLSLESNERTYAAVTSYAGNTRISDIINNLDTRGTAAIVECHTNH